MGQCAHTVTHQDRGSALSPGQSSGLEGQHFQHWLSEPHSVLGAVPGAPLRCSKAVPRSPSLFFSSRHPSPEPNLITFCHLSHIVDLVIPVSNNYLLIFNKHSLAFISHWDGDSEAIEIKDKDYCTHTQSFIVN